MAKGSRRAGTTYRVVAQKNRTYGVEVRRPGAAPYLVTGFKTEAEAETWIQQRMKETGQIDGD
jgi:hypothetical protein